MDRNLEKEAPNVVTEPLFRKLLAMGHQARVLCEGDAHLKSAVWYGVWTVRVVCADGTFEKILVSHPRRAGDDEEIKIKIFRTINGLASFMHRMGFADFNVPFFEGGESFQALSERNES